MVRLQDKYNTEVIPEMMKKFGYKSRMAVPKIEKVVINTGFGRQITGKSGEEQKKFLEFTLKELAIISGQKSVLTMAKKAIASYKTRKGMPLGAKVTLRRKKMTDFLERLINLVFPRTRDFRGISPESADECGNLTIAIKEHIAFPEIIPEKAKNIFGLEVTVTTTAKTRGEGLELLKLSGFPIKK